MKTTNAIFTEAINEWSFKRVKRSGLLTRRSTEKSPTPLFRANYILFPFFREKTCEYLQARVCGQGEPRWLGLSGITKPLYNMDALLGSVTDKSIWICEGITDVLSAAELEKQAIGVLGTSSFSKEAIKLFHGRDVHIVPDADRAGESMGKKLRVLFAQQGISAVVQKLPYGKDVNEYLLINRRNE